MGVVFRRVVKLGRKISESGNGDNSEFLPFSDFFRILMGADAPIPP
jgi:hypothetical protein